jgi:nucleotide-binding universal stress UspA family protein
MSVLVIALDAVIPVEMPDAEVLVVAPALNSRLRHWLSDEDAARRRAGKRAAALVARMERNGVRAEGRVGDADPLLAIADALSIFPADEIVIAAQPGRSTRLADELVARARDRFAIPVLRAGESLARAA